MAKYEDLSRRALIQLGKDYDKLNDDKLQKFLDHNEDLYEGIRPAERLIAGYDKAVETIFGSHVSVRESINENAGSVIERVGDAVATGMCNVITAGAKHLVEMM